MSNMHVCVEQHKSASGTGKENIQVDLLQLRLLRYEYALLLELDVMLLYFEFHVCMCPRS